MKKILVLLFLGVSSVIRAQDQSTPEMPAAIASGEGSIMLNDGKEVTGMLKYNDKTGLISFENSSDIRSFNALSVMGFEFFDETMQRQRIFYTLEFEGKKRTGKQRAFFEVIKDFKTFVVLSKMDPLEIWDSSSPQGGQSTLISKAQTETVCFMNETGEIKPYLEIVRTVGDNKQKKRRILDDELLKTYFKEPAYSALSQYAKENRLVFDRKEHLLKILDYYKTIAGN